MGKSKIDLIGHSGCIISLDSNNSLITKKSSSVDYNSRLKIQGEKQSAFTSDFIHTPKIKSDYFVDNLYVVEMEFINGQKFSNFILDNSFEKINKLYGSILSYVKHNIENSRGMVDLDDIKGKLTSLQSDPTILSSRIIEDLFSLVDRCNVPLGYCHGDLTFENVLTFNGKVYFIDFLDSYINSPFIDISKIYQDIYFKWSFRNQKINVLVDIKLDYMKNSLIQELKLSESDIFSIELLLVINILRIIPYTSDSKLKITLLLETKKIIKKWK